MKIVQIFESVQFQISSENEFKYQLRLCGKRAFPHSFCRRKIDEIMVFFAVHLIYLKQRSMEK